MGVKDSMPRAKGGLTEKRGHLLRTHVSWGLRELFSNKINLEQGVGGRRGGAAQAPGRVFFFLNVKTDSCKRLTSVKRCGVM